MSVVNAEGLGDVSELIWRNRVILIKGSDAEITELQKRRSDIDERHIVWFVIDGQSLTTNYDQTIFDKLSSFLETKYFTEEFSTVLIGKDGGIKMTQNTLNLNHIFSLIDSMPMRIQEMKQANGRG